MSNSFQGQTDQILAIKLASSILSARWLDAEVAVNGEAGLEVRTAFVGDTAPIKITIKDQSGASAGSLDGEILSNLFRTRWKPGAKNAGKNLAFEAELSKHGLERASGPLKVGAIVEMDKLRWTRDGKEVQDVRQGQSVDMEANVKGVVDGSRVFLTVFEYKADNRKQRIVDFPAPVSGGRVKASWIAKLSGGEESVTVQQELDKVGLRYFQPRFTFAAGCKGVCAESKEINLVSWASFEFGPAPDPASKRVAVFELPDGSERKETIPEDGNLKLTASMPGRILFKGFDE